jgi:N-methylhydantoinase A
VCLANPQSEIRNPKWGGAVLRVGVDVGGTFTDLVALGEGGDIRVRKVVTTPADPAVGLFGALDVEGLAPSDPVDVLIHGTTIATNALLERRGARVVLVTTRGFEDLLWLRRQDRAALYDLARDHPPPLVSRGDVVAVAERMGPAGVLEPLADGEVARAVAAVRALAPEAVAVSFLFAFRHAAHERSIAAALRAALPGVPVAASHEVLPVFREFERTSTTTVEAYLRPKVATYLTRLERDVRGRGVAALRVMTSSGGTLPPAAAAARAASLALSGPAGGVVGARLVGVAVGVSELLTLDMGGTSADASLVTGGAPVGDGGGAVAGIPLALPAVLIETVSAGGGSIARLDEGGALKVGPESAGAVPGPACYGRGGQRPTVTDACLVLGWLDAASPLADEVRLEPGAAERAVRSLGPAAGADATRVAAGIVAVAAAVMARALKRVSVARGLDPRRMTLLPFGGAGPLFGCRLADALGMRAIVIPPHPGVLSALGLAAAAERIDLLASFHRSLEQLQPRDIAGAFAPLLAEAASQVPGSTVLRYADCRFAGQGYEVTVPVTADDPRQIRATFLAAHRARHGHAGDGQPVEIVNLRVAALREGALPSFRAATRGAARAPRAQRAVALAGGRATASVWPLDELAAGVTIDGPAILAGRDATALLEPGWRGTVHPSGAVLVERR